MEGCPKGLARFCCGVQRTDRVGGSANLKAEFLGLQACRGAFCFGFLSSHADRSIVEITDDRVQGEVEFELLFLYHLSRSMRG